MLFALLMTSILGINILFYSTFPQYVTYGNQLFIKTVGNETSIQRCSLSAVSGNLLFLSTRTTNNLGSSFLDECTMTRVSLLLLRFFYKAWFFGAYYYWAMWVFLAVSFLEIVPWNGLELFGSQQVSLFSLVYVVIRPRASSIDGLLDNEEIEDDE